MLEFDRPVWGLLNTRTNKLFAPLKIYAVWYRGLYTSEKSAKAAARKLNKEVSELDDGTLSKEFLNKFYGFDVEEVQGEYVPIEIKGGLELCQ